MPPASETAPATLRDVAGRAGVAPITASRILNGSRSASPIAAATRARVERAAAELGYRIDAVARAMRHGRTGQVGVVVANAPAGPLANLAAYEYILGLNAGLADAGLVLSLIRITDVDGSGDAPVRELDERLLAGLVVLGFMPEAMIARIRALGLPTVWLDTDVDESRGCLRRDEEHAGRAAADLLLAHGRRRLVWPERPAPISRNHYSREARERGARAACRAAGAELLPLPLGQHFELGDVEAFRRALADPAAGLLLADPPMALAMLTRLAALRLAPGADLGVACCDADSQLSGLWPGLSRVQPDRYALGTRAARMLADGLAGDALPASVLARADVVTGVTA